MKFDKFRSVLRALALFLIAILLTTCGDDSSSSSEDRGVYGVMADDLQTVADTVLTANADLFASADYMRPYIATLLELSARKIGAMSGPTSCLIDGVGGRVYTINGEPFTSVPDLQVPDYTARFRLFKLSNAGQPIMSQEIGRIDYTCVDFGVPITEVQIFNDSILIASTTYSPTSGNVNGTLRSPDRAVSLVFFGDPQRQGPSGYKFITAIHEVHTASYWSEQTSSQIVDIGVNAAPNGTAPETFFDIDVSANVTGNVTGGKASHTESPITRGAACISSGTIETPVYSRPTQACFGDGVPLLSTTSAERQAMFEIYQSARAYWSRATAQRELCRALVPPLQ